ncbi:DUF4111 domain-containing protein [Paenibacillus alkaliterrae]|uniref:aminoglycoside adenylyltransferase domain-containing protein n=1 Tax=Paenibacillus alkaliterrae TaxID=320909 RepID=UPI001F22F876|nr:aminoglycoside adenylyltransferase domain-containing protein [Paenibacillus alkaliterrae]MCF2940533.1 DUF4111 domain-containing protein [Paenibacillus alkaliterrae]
MTGPQAWPNCDEDIKRFVVNLMERLKSEAGKKVTGIYLHGSLAMGSYYRPKSDIDLIVVVDGKLEADLAEAVGIAIAKVTSNRPMIGNVELSVITADVAKKVPVPTPFEVHYSSGWHDKILNLEVDYSKERTDTDLSSHLAYVAQRGVCLYGKPISEIFGQVNWQHFMEAVMDDLDWILEDEHILETPFYSVLNICRVFQLMSEDCQSVHSKDEGGEWGLGHLPQEYHTVIQLALDVYRSSDKVTEEHRKTGGKEWDQAKLLAFRNFARMKIKNELGG